MKLEIVKTFRLRQEWNKRKKFIFPEWSVITLPNVCPIYSPKKKKKRKTCLLAHFLFAILVNSLSLTPMFSCSRHQSGCYEIYIWMLGIKTTKTLNWTEIKHISFQIVSITLSSTEKNNITYLYFYPRNMLFCFLCRYTVHSPMCYCIY